MISFSIPRHSADRLARLGLASDTGAPTSTLAQIGVRVGLQVVRFSATNGRILASLVVPIDDLQGDPDDVILDRDQLAAALKTTAKVHGGRIQVRIDNQEARLTNGTATAVVRRHTGGFPDVQHVWTRPAGRRWVPTMSSLDPNLTSIAQKIAGNKNPLLFMSPVDPATRWEQVWSVSGAQPREGIDISQIRSAITAPAYWADHELAILAMPITRSDGERQLDLSPHALSLSQAAAVAA